MVVVYIYNIDKNNGAGIYIYYYIILIKKYDGYIYIWWLYI